MLEGSRGGRRLLRRHGSPRSRISLWTQLVVRPTCTTGLKLAVCDSEAVRRVRHSGRPFGRHVPGSRHGVLSKRGSRAARVCLACATAVAVTVVGIGQAPPSYAAPGTVTGSVFQDFDGDGTRDAGNTAAGVQTDIGFAGVTVTAYGPHNEVVGTAATAANGSYTINTTSVPDGTPLRIEFTDANGGTTPQLSGDFQSSFHGAGNGTSVQFAAAGDDERRLRGARTRGLRRQQRPDRHRHPVRRPPHGGRLHQSAGRGGEPLGGACERPDPAREHHLPGPCRSGLIRCCRLRVGHRVQPPLRTPPTQPRPTSASPTWGRWGSAGSTGSPMSSTRPPAH